MNTPTLKEFKAWIQARQDAALAELRGDKQPTSWDKFATTATVIREIEKFTDEAERAEFAAYLARRAS